MQNKYVIIGCQPRGASFYMRTLLRALGLQVGHEDPEKDGVVGWQHLMPNHQWTLKALQKWRLKERVYLMQMRHPVPTVNSMAAMYFRRDWPPLAGGLDVQYMCKMERNDTPVVRAMKLYYHLNLMGMQDPKFKIRYHIEDIDKEWPIIADAIGMPGIEMPDIPRDTNTHRDRGKYPDLTWQEIFDMNPHYGLLISKLAGSMGYDVGAWGQTELSRWSEQHKEKGK
jgi:hypothetical protein